MTLYSSDGDEKFTIIVSIVVIELKNGVCAVFRIEAIEKKEKIEYIIQLVSN